MTAFLLALALCFALITYWFWSYKSHLQRIEKIPLRIHVNGIRGKSTVTRLVAGVLREAGYKTLAKTTGSAARVIHPDGSETPIQRWGAPTISEQVNIVREHFEDDLDALVIECMAVNPEYQNISQHQIIKGNFGVITNVREDHQDLMGESLPEIALSLANTIPIKGRLITAEDRAELRDILEVNAQASGSSFAFADASRVTDADLAGFDYLAFKENVAIGLQVAQELGISQEVALRGMQKAQPDIGAVFLKEARINNTDLLWVPMFAVNDRESTVIGIETLKPHHRKDAVRVGLLNNRLDRVVRAQQFADIAVNDLRFDYYVTLGAFERQVSERMIAAGFPKERIINLASEEANAEKILEHVAGLNPFGQVVLIGLVNIHTEQAEALMDYFWEVNMFTSPRKTKSSQSLVLTQVAA